MSQMLQTMHDAVTLAADPVIPGFKPSLPGTLQTPTDKILSWTAGGGLSPAVLGSLTGSVVSAVGIGVTGFYTMTQGGA